MLPARLQSLKSRVRALATPRRLLLVGLVLGAVTFLLVSELSVGPIARGTLRRRSGNCSRTAYIAMTGCCLQSGIGHALMAFNRVVHIAKLRQLVFVYDPAPLSKLGHQIGSIAEPFFNLGKGEVRIEDIPRPYDRVNLTALVHAVDSDNELLSCIDRYLREHPPSCPTPRPLLFDMHRIFVVGGRLASDWNRTASWWRSKYQPRRLPCRGGRRSGAASECHQLVVHIRRGDQTPLEGRRAYGLIEKGLLRHLPDAWYVAAADAAWRAHCARRGTRCSTPPLEIHVATEEPFVDMDGTPSRVHTWLQDRFPQAAVYVHPGGDALQAFNMIAGADVLICSRSDFSRVAAHFLRRASTVLLPPDGAPPALPCRLTRGSLFPFRAYGPMQLNAVNMPPASIYWPVRGVPPEQRGQGDASVKRETPTERPVWRMSHEWLPKDYVWKAGPLNLPGKWDAVLQELQSWNSSVLSSTVHDTVVVDDVCAAA